ncbi:MAG: HutD family protein [Bacteroidota bacterium]|nr:HutD family protein [Bacteroidota bacterium]
MKIHFFPFAEQPVNKWSGGITRQLAIYPFNASLEERDFIFRISTATVETETSLFSKFPGFQRILMILEGELKIDHKGHHTKKLKPFETDAFDGSWETTAEGMVVDFNVIYSGKIKTAEVKKFELSKNKKQILGSANFSGFYILSGLLTINGRELNEKDFVLVEQEKVNEKIELAATSDCQYILVLIDTP